MKFVVCGLSITSSWGNGHATTYRALLRALAARGHELLFLERDFPWYAENRDLPDPPYCRVELYNSLDELCQRFTREVREADVVIVGSYVPDGAAAGHWVTRVARGITAFYDIDTPVTLMKLARGECGYLSPELIPKYCLYLSFTGGPTLRRIEHEFGSPRARVLYCSVDPDSYYPEPSARKWALGYLGTYDTDRQRTIDALLLDAARSLPDKRFVVAGSLYPENLLWPENVDRIEHLPPSGHRQFYNSQQFALNVTRPDMIRAGYSPSVRLFEAAACGTPIISDHWEGLSEVFEVGREILVARDTADSLCMLTELTETDRERIGRAARLKVLTRHTAMERVKQLEGYIQEISNESS